MNENIKLLAKKLSEDEAMQAKLKAIRDPDEAYALVSSIQGGFTKEEFIEAMQQLGGQGELSDEEVAAAAGGSSSDVVSWLISKGEDLALSSAASTV